MVATGTAISRSKIGVSAAASIPGDSIGLDNIFNRFMGARIVFVRMLS